LTHNLIKPAKKAGFFVYINYLLEKMRTAGTIEGTFRYAEPGDNSDALCNKLTDIFSFSEKSSTTKNGKNI